MHKKYDNQALFLSKKSKRNGKANEAEVDDTYEEFT
jgi:hypothetical protein